MRNALIIGLLTTGLFVDHLPADDAASDKHNEASMEEVTLERRCVQEIIDLHQFFEEWFNAQHANDDDGFARFTDVMAEDFEIIGPDGVLTSRDAVVGVLQSAHGARPGIEIEIKSPHARDLGVGLGDGLCLGTYEEWQTRDGEVRKWISTVVMRQDDDAPNGLVWLRVHETYLPDDAR